MDDFRKVMPVRRTDVPSVNKYGEYKPLLREDFHQRCGYCGDHDFFRDAYYEVDHFVPKDIDSDREKDYSNLVYSCRTCNNTKRKKWPTNDKTRPNNGTEGFVDPCDPAYNQQFERLVDGSIRAVTPLGQWMWVNMAFGNPCHRIKWLLEQLRIELRKLETMENSELEDLEKYKELSSKYHDYEEALRGTPTF